ncbi:antitoxin VbhA family protein [Nocardiopsis halotolerans]|uniref:antitoxin VbhA family protein n=1 Tax=Nocardiopsis halotolerans TaxID=124252 RepID=UPI00034A996C|nr:antitoxin VbhA family protein [Nocardiopsis halotolerans]
MGTRIPGDGDTAAALASVRAAGGEPSPEARADLERVARGEMSFEEARERILARYQLRE